MIVGFSGSRNYTNVEKVLHIIESLLLKYNDELIIHVGDCNTGLDKIVKNICIDKNINHKIFYADWNSHGKIAGPLRNKEILVLCNELYAFKCSNSLNKGTSNCTSIALRNNIKTHVFVD